MTVQIAPAAQVALRAALERGTLPITSACNLACVFCSNHQNPPEVQTFRLPHRDLDSVRDDIALLPRSGRIVVGEAATRIDEGEPFLHPDCDRILAEVRSARPDAELVVTTNGTLLSEQRIDLIAALRPVSVNLSLNAITPQARRLWLGDRQPGAATAAARRLTRHGITWHGSLVAMPHLTGWEELNRTLDFLAMAGAATARVFLPGYTRLAPPDLVYGSDLWPKLLAFVDSQRQRMALPITVEPPQSRDLDARLVGVINGSPAAAAGLRTGDVIADIAGHGRPRCRVDCFRILSRGGPHELTVSRAGQVQNVSLTNAVPGVVLDYDIDPRQVDRAVAQIARARGETLILTGVLAEPIVSLALASAATDLPWRVVAVPNRFFGGSIMAAGLLTVADLVAAGRAAIADGPAPALIMVPGLPFDDRGCDLTGQPYLAIAEALSAPVALIE